MPSYDIVSEVDLQEVENAINQARKEIEHRYDLRGGQCKVEWDKKAFSISANDEMKLKAMKDILQTKMHKRGVEISALKFEKVEPMGGMILRQKGSLVQGIEREKAKEIVKALKDTKMKVQAQIMDELIRVSSKSIDELQESITFCRGAGFGIPLQFTNMRA